jgi:hypothetical protein
LCTVVLAGTVLNRRARAAVDCGQALDLGPDVELAELGKHEF